MKVDKRQDYIAALVQLKKQGRKTINGMSINDAIKLMKVGP